jgi:Ser/Thr protein kinase RdoA (MazF antagonist)
MNTEQLIRFIEITYGLKTKASVLHDGPDNTVWMLDCADDKRYIARVSKREMKDGIAFEAEWLRYLRTKNVPVATIINTLTGRAYSITPTGKAVTVFDFVPGHHISISQNTPIPIKAVTSAARALAKIHDVSRGHKIDLPRSRTIFTEMERALSMAGDIEEKVPGGKQFIREVKEYQSWAKRYMFTPVLVHNDYRVGNILFDDTEEVAAVIDFDWCCIGPAIKDVAHALIEWSLPDKSPKHFKEVFDGFLKAYNDAVSDPITDGDDLYRWISFAALSDACTYIVDRLDNGEIKAVDSCYMYRKFEYFRAMM